MEIDPLEHAHHAGEGHGAKDPEAARLTSWVAITVALLATFLGICKVKNDNIVLAMQQAQASRIDHWSFYQARNIREEIARSTQVLMALAAAAPGAQQAAYKEAAANYQKLEASQAQKKDELRIQAEQDERTYETLNRRHDQFDLNDALLALAISLLAVTALTGKRWLYWLAMVPTFLGALMGLAGLFGWPLYLDALSRLLS